MLAWSMKTNTSNKNQAVDICLIQARKLQIFEAYTP
jgi:hypothetical protein